MSSATMNPMMPPPVVKRSWKDGPAGFFVRPETITVLLFAGSLAAMLARDPNFTFPYFLSSTTEFTEVGLMALAMTLVIISGNIDLSVASGLALTGVVGALLYEKGVPRLGIGPMPMGVVIPFAMVFGGMLGLFNGLLITKVRLPSLTATLGTFALYRGVAQILLGDRSVGKFPDWFVGVDMRSAGIVPVPLIALLVVAVVFGLVLHKTVFGRCVYAIGTSEPAARFSGIRTERVKLAVFVISGVMMGAAAMMMISRLSVARYTLAQGNESELTVITAVVLGGTSIFGGSGSIFGTITAVMLLCVLRSGMNVAEVAPERQLAVTGTLLVVSVILTNLMNRWTGRRRD